MLGELLSVFQMQRVKTIWEELYNMKHSYSNGHDPETD